MKPKLAFGLLPLLAFTALACASIAPTATPAAVLPGSTTTSAAAASVTPVASAAPTRTVPPATDGRPSPSPAATGTAVPTLTPTEAPADRLILPETLGQLRLRWHADFPGDFDSSLGCDAKAQACTLFTNVAAYAFSRDGRTLAVSVCLGTRTKDQTQPNQGYWGCTAETVIILYEAATGAERGRLVSAGVPITLAFHPAGQVLAAGLANSAIELWDLPAGERSGGLSAIPLPSGVSHLAFTPDGRRLVSGGAFQVQVWDWQAEALLGTLEQVIGIGLSPDSRGLVTLHVADYPAGIRLYDLDQLPGYSEIPLAGQSQPTEFSFSPRSGLISSAEVGSSPFLASFWDPASQSVTASLRFDAEYETAGVLYDLNSGGFTPAGHFLILRAGKLLAPEAQPEATGLSDTLYACGFALADVEANRMFFSRPMLYDECTGPAYLYSLGLAELQPQIISPDGRYIAADDGFGSLRLWGIDASLPALPPECSGACAP